MSGQDIEPLKTNPEVFQDAYRPAVFGKKITGVKSIPRPLSYWLGSVHKGYPNDYITVYPDSGNKAAVLMGDANEQEFPIPANGINVCYKDLPYTYIVFGTTGDIVYSGKGALAP